MTDELSHHQRSQGAQPQPPPPPATQQQPQRHPLPPAQQPRRPDPDSTALQRKDFYSFAHHLQDAAMLFKRQGDLPPYRSVSVLLLRWDEDTSVDKDLVALEELFKRRFNYQTDRWNIPSVANPSIKLGIQMASFLEHAKPNHLLIIYYAGHGYLGTDNQVYWAWLVHLFLVISTLPTN